MNKPPLGLLMRLRSYLDKNKMDDFARVASKTEPYDLAWCLGRVPVEDQARALISLKPPFAARALQEMPLEKQTTLLSLGRLPGLVKVVSAMDSDELADLLGALPADHKFEWMASLPQTELREAESLLAYPPDTAGGLMAKEYVSVPTTLTAGQAASRLQTLASNFENFRVTYVYAISPSGELEGVVPVRDLVLTSKETPIDKILIRNVATLPDTASKKEVAELFRQRNLLALPVVNAENRLVGIITSDDVMDVIQELADEEMLKISGVSAEETRDAPTGKIVKKRLSWLSLNIFLNLISASVIAFFEDTLSAVIALAFFLPIISDMSGCSGMQSVALSVRDLALRRILPADYWRVLKKEIMVSLLNGLALGIIIGLVAYLLRGNAVLGAVVAIALWINTLIAASFGGVVPLLVKRFNFDPAIASGPLLTTLTDVMGFFILLGLATLWLPYLT